MKNNYCLKAILFIFINSIFLLQVTKSYELDNEIKDEISFTHKQKNQEKEFNLKQENFFNKNKINPLSIFLAFEKTENSQEDKNEFLIESDEQFENQDSFVAKGNVIIKVKGATLKTNYIKFLKRGFGRTAHLTSIDIRNQRMDRSKALELCKMYDGKKPKSLDIFLKIIQISEDEFYDLVQKHIVSPNKVWNREKLKKNKSNITPSDFDHWIQKFT